MMIPLGAVIVAAIVAAVGTPRSITSTDGRTDHVVLRDRKRRAVHRGRRRPPAARAALLNIPVVFSDLFPLVGPVAGCCSDGVAWLLEPWRRRRLEGLLWCWIVAVVGCCSLSAGKQDLGILPIVPAVAALGALHRTPGARALSLVPAGGVVAGDRRLAIRRGWRGGAGGCSSRRGRTYALVGASPIGLLGSPADSARRVRPTAVRWSALTLLAATYPSTGSSLSACCQTSSATSRCHSSAARCRPASAWRPCRRIPGRRCRAWVRSWQGTRG